MARLPAKAPITVFHAAALLSDKRVQEALFRAFRCFLHDGTPQDSLRILVQVESAVSRPMGGAQSSLGVLAECGITAGSRGAAAFWKAVGRFELKVALAEALRKYVEAAGPIGRRKVYIGFCPVSRSRSCGTARTNPLPLHQLLRIKR